MNLLNITSLMATSTKVDKFQCMCDGCNAAPVAEPYVLRSNARISGMNIHTAIAIYGGGPGSGCHGDNCGRPEGSGGTVQDKSGTPGGDKSLAQVVTKKFERYEKLVKAVVDKKINGLAVFGERGIGKSKTVIDVLDREGKDAVKIRGQITPKELFNTLSQNRGPDDIVWFDDADSAFKDTTALNILKAALDSDEPREISWLSSKKDEDMEQTFRFQGRIIVTTNIQLDKNEHVAALTDRMHWMNLKLSSDEKMFRIEQVAPKMLSNLDKATAGEVVKWVKEHKDEIGDNMSLRVVKKIGELASFDPEWKDMAQSFVEETNAISPSKGGRGDKYSGPTEGEPKGGTRAPKGDSGEKEHKYAGIVTDKGFTKTSATTYEGKKGKVTFDGRNWTLTPKTGKATSGKGSKSLINKLG